MSSSNPLNILQPRTASELVGFNLENAGGAKLPTQIISFGQAFLPGQFRAGESLIALINGVATPVQVDVRNRNPDGSVSFAQITLQQPELAAGAKIGGLLAISATAQAAGSGVDLAAAVRRHSLFVDLNIQSGWTTGPVHVDVTNAMQAALANGTAGWWQSGPLASQARVTIPISGSLYLQVDITAFADGDFKADVHFNNDLAMGATGGTITYAATITLDGSATVQPQLTHYQYQNWNRVVETQSHAFVNVQHDLDYLERTGLVANFDQDRAKFSANTIKRLPEKMAASTWNAPFSPNGIYQGMPGTGGRPDIGPTTGANADWLLTGDARAAQYAIDQARAADGIPWHYRDVATGTWLNTSKYPNLWIDPRGGTGAPGGLKQQLDPKNNGWVPQRAHQPDNSYVPYLLTGERSFLDELNAQASYAVMDTWPYQRLNGQALVARYQETRADAWSLRQVQEAARVNPDGTAEQHHYSAVTNANWKWLVSMIPTWTQNQGEAYGYIGDSPIMNSNLKFAPWQNDYFATTTIAAASQGNEDAKIFLKYQAHFLAGRFLNMDAGFNPHNGSSYFVVPGAVQESGIRTWAGMQAATVAAGYDIGNGWNNANYAELALTSLAGIITVLGDTREGFSAMKAYGWLVSSDAPYLTSESQFQIAPRLSDGRLLNWSNITLSHSTAGTTSSLRGPDATANQLLHSGPGDDTLIGGFGVNILYAGAGNDRLMGGANADYLFGGTGRTLFEGGAGRNYMDAGKGPGTFLLKANDVAQDTIEGFKLGIDHLQIHDGSDPSASAPALQRWITDAVQDAEGNVVLRLSATHTLTLKGISVAQLSAAAFMPPTAFSSPPPTASIPRSPIAPATVTPVAVSATPPPASSPAVDINIPTVITIPGQNTLTLRLSGDSWKGDPQFRVAVDGKVLGLPQTVSASRAKGETQSFVYKGDFGPGQHKVAVTFLNDGSGGAPTGDRNLYVMGVEFDGTSHLQKPISLLGPYTAAVTVNQLIPSAHSTATLAASSSSSNIKTMAMYADPLPSDQGINGNEQIVDIDDPSFIVARIYQAALGRLPDAGGLEFWMGSLAQGISLPDLAAGFLDSPEFGLRYGQLDNTNYVDQLYYNILDRAGDAEGRSFWTGRLDEGTTRQAILTSFSESDENRLLTAPVLATAQFY